MKLNLLCRDEPGEVLEGAVVGSFGVRGKTASGELPAFEVILDAFAAKTVSGASFIAARAFGAVFFFLAFHFFTPFLSRV